MDLRRSGFQLWACCFGFLLGLSACNIKLDAPDQPNSTQHPEVAYCGAAQAKTYSGAVTAVSGNAKFQYRALDWTSGTCNGLCSIKTLNIPYAEVNIVDAAGTIIQCGETDANGNFSNLSIPRTLGSYKVQVFSRSQTASVKASVLEDIYTANPYSIEAPFEITSSVQTAVTGISLVASARASDSNSKIPGAAFNILANVYWANQFLRARSGDPSFSAEKVTIFWKAGFNPYSYFGSPGALASFYVSTENRLYILGGKNGDVKNSDTDHFDDSVILHEYGHFLEARYGHSDSQGGSHNGNFIIDPRLAWSEGWANYFQAAVLDTIVYASGMGPKGTGGFTYYIDTVGFKNDAVEGSGPSAGVGIKMDLTESAATASFDRPGTNEGIFREFSISRTLFKTLKAAIPFSAVWEVFTSLNDVNGSYTPPHKFINFGLFNFKLNLKITDSTQKSDWQSILIEEKQKADTSLYGNTLNEQAPTPSCPTITMTPVADAIYGYDRSNQLMSNDFYTYKHNGQNKTLSLTYATGGDGTNVVDLNLYLYSSEYLYSEEIQEAKASYTNSTMLRKSKSINISDNTQTETFDLSGLPAGYYMINVKASTYGKTSAYFSSGGVAYATYYLYSNESAGIKCLVPNY